MNVIAEFGSPEDARAAIEAFEHHGIDGVEISVPPPPPNGRRQPADERALLHAGGRVGTGIGVGTVVGAALFAVVGAVFLVIGWPIGAAVALVLAGAAIGGTAGAFIGVERGVGMSESWEQTFHEPRAHRLRVEVRPTSGAEVTTARRVLEEQRPLVLRESSGAGR